jgi:hypothetical protein
VCLQVTFSSSLISVFLSTSDWNLPCRAVAYAVFTRLSVSTFCNHLKLWTYLIVCLYFIDLLIGLEVSEYVAGLGILLWGLEQEIRAEGSFCHRKSSRKGSSRSKWILGLMASGCGNSLHRMTWLPLVLTNRNAYIWCTGEELRSNPAKWWWGTGVSVELHCLEATRRWYELSGGSFVFRRTGDAFCDFGSSL